MKEAFDMNEHSIYKSLKFLKNGNVITSTELLQHHFFKKGGLDAINSRFSELMKLGYISGRMSGKVISLQITGKGKVFLQNYHYCKQLKNIERLMTFLAGIVSGFIASYAIPWFIANIL